MKNYIGLILFCLLLVGCYTKYTPHNPPEPNGATLDVQQKATLAFVSYAGDELKNTDSKVDEALQACVAWELKRQPILDDRFTLAWGPSVYRFELAELDDNMMYAVWDNQNNGELVIGIRGTNPKSISDWLAEDFYVTKTVPWRYAKPENINARITNATNIGLTALQRLKGKNHTSDVDGSILLEDFLLENMINGKLTKITVTGHSLAGALAPVFALWLKDDLFAKAGIPKVNIDVLPIAGASPGNADFASYYDQRLGDSTNRLHNPFDVVPQAWFSPTMRALPSIYYTDEQFIRPTSVELAVFDLGIELSKGKSYTQINAGQASTGGKISLHAKDKSCKLTFAAQASWQHHCGYYHALGMSKKLFNINSSCLTENYCNKNPKDKNCEALYQHDDCTKCKSGK